MIRVMAHPRVLKWYSHLIQKIEREEEEAILREMEDEDVLKAFYESDL